MNILSIILILSVALCTVLTQLLLKGVGASIGQLIPELSLNNVSKLVLFVSTEPKVLLAITLQGLGFILWIVVLSKEHAGVALGLGGASVYLLTSAVEWFIYDTHFGIIKILALILISTGALLLAIASS